MERIESSESITVSTPPQLSLKDDEVIQYDGPPPRRRGSGGPRILKYGEEEDVVYNVATQDTGKLRASGDMASLAPQRGTVVVSFWCAFLCQGATVGLIDGEVQLPVTVYEGADLHAVAAHLGPQRLNEFELMSLRDQYGDQTIRQLMKEELDREQATGIAIVIENEVEDRDEGLDDVLNPDSQELESIGPMAFESDPDDVLNPQSQDLEVFGPMAFRSDPYTMDQEEMEDVGHEMPIAEEAVAPHAYGAYGHYAYPWP